MLYTQYLPVTWTSWSRSGGTVPLNTCWTPLSQWVRWVSLLPAHWPIHPPPFPPPHCGLFPPPSPSSPNVAYSPTPRPSPYWPIPPLLGLPAKGYSLTSCWSAANSCRSCLSAAVKRAGSFNCSRQLTSKNLYFLSQEMIHIQNVPSLNIPSLNVPSLSIPY